MNQTVQGVLPRGWKLRRGELGRGSASLRPGPALMWGSQAPAGARGKSLHAERYLCFHETAALFSPTVLAVHPWLRWDAGSGWHPPADVRTAWREESAEKVYPELYWKNQSAGNWRRNVKGQDSCCQGSVFSSTVQQTDGLGCEDVGPKFTYDQLVHATSLNRARLSTKICSLRFQSFSVKGQCLFSLVPSQLGGKCLTTDCQLAAGHPNCP